MKENYKNFTVERLTKSLCEKKIIDILEILKLIPNSNYKKENILVEKKEDRILFGKWEYSLLLLNKDEIVGVLIAYKREKEKSGLYLENYFYINEIAISRKYKGQGLREYLLKYFIDGITEYKYLDGKIKFRIQTTNSKENRKVIELYERVGFKKIGIKKYLNKEDSVMEILKGNNYKK